VIATAIAPAAVLRLNDKLTSSVTLNGVLVAPCACLALADSCARYAINFASGLDRSTAVAECGASMNRERYVKHRVQESRGGIPKASHLAS